MANSMFGTDGIRGLINKYPVDPITIVKLGMALGKIGNTVIIGKDTRISGYMLESSLTSGLIAVGCNVMLVGPLPSAAIALLVRETKSDLGIMISASHNPYHDNGIKIFNSQGVKLSSTEEELIESQMVSDYLSHKLTETKLLGKAKRLSEAQSIYINYAINKFPQQYSLKNKKIVLDCANGAAYQVAPKILQKLGAEVIALNTKPNGLNINRKCGSLYPQLLSQHVQQCKADIGISLDGDADRVVMCDENGNIINGESILTAIIKAQVAKTQNKKVVSNVMASLSFENYLKSQNITLIRSPVGEQNLISRMKEHKCMVGGEPSGHVILLEHNTTSDGIIAALEVLALMSDKNEKASKVCKSFEAQPMLLKNVPIHNTNINLHSPKITELIRQSEQRLGKSGRLLIRKSGTEPMIRVLAEGRDIESVRQTVSSAVKIISENPS